MTDLVTPIDRSFEFDAGGQGDLMERRTALAIAAAASLLSASGVVAVGAGALRSTHPPASTDLSSSATTPVDPEPQMPLAPVEVTETRDVFDTIVIPSAAKPDAPADRSAIQPIAAVDTGEDPTGQPAPPTTPTTIAATTSTTRPPGVPADWPADRPIPPMPADCQQAQLEDNGTWNCDH